MNQEKLRSVYEWRKSEADEEGRVLPTNLSELDKFCREEVVLSESTRYSLGRESENGNGWILGEYGLVQIDSRIQVEVVRCGFRLADNCMNISHTPQGLNPRELENMPGDVKRRLRSREFRMDLMVKLEQIAQSLGCESMKGGSSVVMPVVVNELVDDLVVWERVDMVFLAAGFEFVDGEYFKSLTR